MINIPKFETHFHGKRFKDSCNREFTAVGYGDNGSNGGPYLIGIDGDPNGNNPNGVKLKTVLLKEVTIIG